MQGDGELRAADRGEGSGARAGLRVLGARRLLFYVSAHGFGHASRSAALIRSLRERGGAELEVHVRSQAAPRFFRSVDPELALSAAPVDVALAQPNGLDVDLAASLAGHLAFLERWEEHVEREAAFIRASGASLVIGDIPPLAFAAAERAGVPAAAVANFSWDWILAGFAEDEPRWRPVVDRFASAYAAAEVVYRLPFHGGFETARRVVDAPLLVPRGRGDLEAVRRALGIAGDERRPLVLVSFGGFGAGRVRFDASEDLSDFLFVGYQPRPPGLRAEWKLLDDHAPVPHPDLVAQSDAVIGKTGYGTAAEALASRTPFLYLTRPGFRESPILAAGLEALGCAREIRRQDFLSGRWREPLEGLLGQPAPEAPIAADGDRVIADALLARIGG